MKRMKLSELTGNEILAQSLMTWDYQIILPEGVVLKKEYISKIEEMGILEVNVKEDQENEIVILTATSGDTGKAALAGFADVPGTRIIVFYPKGGVSKIQERQMVTQKGATG